MKKLFVAVFAVFFIFNLFADQNDKEVLTLKYQAIAIGQLSLAYRLIALSTSLSIAKAVDADYIVSLLDNVDSTISNCKKIIGINNNDTNSFTKEIITGTEFLLNCSKNVKNYSLLQNYDNLTKVRECIDESSKIIDKLSVEYNKISSISTHKNKNEISK